MSEFRDERDRNKVLTACAATIATIGILAAANSCNNTHEVFCEPNGSYTAQPGDTLYGIADELNKTTSVPDEVYVKELAIMNPEAVPQLRAGQTLVTISCATRG